MCSDIFLIAGLGNIGKEYDKTRHNVGFMFLDFLASYLKINIASSKFNSQITSITLNTKKILLAKPQTFMNRSGVAISEIVNFYKIPLDNVLVVTDDMDLEFAKIKLKSGGGDAGHNGIKSIDSLIGKGYAKLKIGIGRPEYSGQVTDYVLSKFTKDELKNLDFIFELVCRNLNYLIDLEYEAFLNIYHLELRKNGI